MAKKRKKFYRLNHQIQAKKVRVVDEKGEQIGILPLNKALQKAENQKLDLVEVAPNAHPPVCKIIDFKKLRYQKKKKRAGQKSKQTELKEIRLSPFIDDNDLNIRVKKAREFLKEKNQVRFSILFRGREISKKKFGYELFKKVIDKLKNCAKIHQEPKFKGRKLEMILYPDGQKAET